MFVDLSQNNEVQFRNSYCSNLSCRAANTLTSEAPKFDIITTMMRAFATTWRHQYLNHTLRMGISYTWTWMNTEMTLNTKSIAVLMQILIREPWMTCQALTSKFITRYNTKYAWLRMTVVYSNKMFWISKSALKRRIRGVSTDSTSSREPHIQWVLFTQATKHFHILMRRFNVNLLRTLETPCSKDKPIKSQMFWKSDCMVRYKTIAPPRRKKHRRKLLSARMISELLLKTRYFPMAVGRRTNPGVKAANIAFFILFCVSLKYSMIM